MPAPSQEVKPKTYHIVTLGCRTNQADSGILQRKLREAGYRPAAAEEAELIILNTCTVTHRADQDSRRLARQLHRRNPAARLFVTGCYAERAPELLAQIDGVSGVATHEELFRFPVLWQGEEDGPSVGTEFPQAGPDRDHTRPFVKIQDGCDSRCSYCIVPLVRGAACSVPPEQVLAQVARLIQEGFQEMVLTGIHLGSYGRKLIERCSLGQLVGWLLELPGLGRLRLSGIEPMEFSEDLIRLAGQSPLLAPHFHLPLQSGSAEVLRRMRRPYTPEEYLDTVRQIRGTLPDAGIGADILTGFPGETEDQHQESIRLVQNSPVDFLHVFSYSPRPGTLAAQWAPLPSEVVRRRSAEFHRLAEEKRLQFGRRFLGRSLRALTLTPLADGQGTEALTGNYLSVRIPSTHLPANCWIDVQVEQITSREITGRIASF
jgi:threonylcarbamoyladenosine tRNA methylthiotransferase MtaB